MIKKIQLKNGLNVLMIPSTKSPVVTVQMWVKTGGADEAKGEEGISHFIEHLLFKGTEKYKVGEIASTIEGAGGELNAYTSFDQTVFHVTLSKHYLDLGFDTISQMLFFPLFDPAEIDNEREVVIEEIKRSTDSPHRQAAQILFSSAYPKHGYGRPVLGFDKVIKNVSKKTIESYFFSRYNPKNMFLLVCGDFDLKEATTKIKETFSLEARAKFRAVKRKPVPAKVKPTVVIKTGQFQEAYLHIGWPIPKALHKDIPGLDVLGSILGQGDSSRLVQNLRIEKHVANSVSCGTFTPKDSGLLVCSASFNADNLEPVVAGIMGQIGELMANGPQTDELARVVNNFECDEYYGLETVDGLASRIGHYEFLAGDPLFQKKFLKQVHALKPQDIQKLAKKYIQDKRVVATLLLPDSFANKIPAVRAKLAKALKLSKTLVKADAPSKGTKKAVAKKVAVKKVNIKLEKSGQKEPQLERLVLKGGGTLILCPNRETAVVSVRSACLGGMRVLKSSEQGLSELMARTWSSGSKNWPERVLYQTLDSISASVASFGGKNTVGLSGTCLKPFEEQLLDIYLDVLLNPDFLQHAVDRERQVLLEDIRSMTDSPAQIAMQKFASTLFGEHPYGMNVYGNEASVLGFSREDVVSYWSRVFSAKNTVTVIAGNVNPDLWIQHLDQVGAEINSGVRFDQRFAHHAPTSEQKVFIELKKEQSHIVVGYKGLTFGDSDRYILEVIRSILSGQGGRLFYELRDKASLAYTVSPLAMDGMDTGYFGGYIGCSPEKGKKAIEMMKTEFAKLCQKRVESDELERAKRYIIGRHDISLQRNSNVAASILFDDIYGLPYDETFNYHNRIKDISSEDVQRVAKRIFEQPAVITAVGPIAPF